MPSVRLSSPHVRCEVCAGPGFVTLEGHEGRRQAAPGQMNVKYIVDTAPLTLCPLHTAEALERGAPSLNPAAREP